MHKINRTRVLFVPDSFWGEDSGHRSSKYTLKVLTKIGYEVALYAMNDKLTELQLSDFNRSGCYYYEQTPYSFKHQFLKSKVHEEFSKIIREFRPDVVLYIGSIANKTSIDCDLLESTLDVLRFVEPLLEDGALIYFDDWRLCRGNPKIGERGAVTQWLKENPHIDLLEFDSTHWQHQWFIFNRIA